MALTTTQALIREAVQRTADVVAFTDRHTPASINHLINRGLGALSTLCRTTNPEFRPLGSTTIACNGADTFYPLPTDFRTLLSVEYTGDDGHKTWLNPYELHERARLVEPDLVNGSTRAGWYRVIGDNIELLPLPPDGHSALLWYASTATQLAADADTFDTMDRLDSYVIWWAAREIAMERGDWIRHDKLSEKLISLEGDIRILARSIDLSAASRPVDLAHANRRWGRWHR